MALTPLQARGLDAGEKAQVVTPLNNAKSPGTAVLRAVGAGDYLALQKSLAPPAGPIAKAIQVGDMNLSKNLVGLV